jgi:hypothetical protein
MPSDSLSATIDLLEKVGLSANDSEIDGLLRELDTGSRSERGPEELTRLKSSLTLIRQSLRDSSVSERGLNLLIETTHDLSKTLELEHLLRTIVARARNLVGAHLAWVTILDDESGLFRTVAAEGYLSPSTAKMTARSEYGAVSLIMKTKSFFDTQDYLNDKRFRHLPELDRTFETENIVSLAGFPILSDDDVHGFLFLADRYPRKLSGREISVLGSFALHAGVAIRNANAFRLLSAALDEAQRNRSTLIEHIRRVEASAAAHDEMTSLLAAGGELQHFLQQVANQIGGAIFLCDTKLRIRDEFVSAIYRGDLATDLRAGKMDTAAIIAATSQSRHTGRSAVVVDIGQEHCRAIALHDGAGRSECLVICYQGARDVIEIRNLERSAVALSIARLWNEKRETEKLIASSTLLRHLVLVTPADPATISGIRDRLALQADESVSLALFMISGLDRASQTDRIRESSARVNVLVDLLDDAYVAVGTETGLHDFLQQLTVGRQGWDVGGIVSEPFADLADAPHQFARMNHALRILQKMKRLGGFISQSEVNLFARLFESGDTTRVARYLGDILKPIDEKAPRQRAELKKTLLCYLDSRYSIKATADTLGLHANTVRQRLETLRQILGEWEEPVRALELHVALRLEALIERPPEVNAAPARPVVESMD